MRKQQRTAHLPGELFQLTEAFEARRGAKFNRQALAALMQFFLTDPDTRAASGWIRQAVAVEKGERSLLECAIDFAERQYDAVRFALQQAQDAGIEGAALDPYVGPVHAAYHRLKQWKAIAADPQHDSPLAALIAHWEQGDWGLPHWKEMYPDEPEEQTEDQADDQK